MADCSSMNYTEPTWIMDGSDSRYDLSWNESLASSPSAIETNQRNKCRQVEQERAHCVSPRSEDIE